MKILAVMKRNMVRFHLTCYFKFFRKIQIIIKNAFKNKRKGSIFNMEDLQFSQTGAKWSIEEDQQLITEYNAGNDIVEIARTHKRLPNGLYSIFRMIHYLSHSDHDVRLNGINDNSSKCRLYFSIFSCNNRSSLVV